MNNLPYDLIGIGIGMSIGLFFKLGMVQKTGPYDEYYEGRIVTISTWELNKKHWWCLAPLILVIIGFILLK